MKHGVSSCIIYQISINVYYSGDKKISIKTHICLPEIQPLHIPAGIWCKNDVVSTLMPRPHNGII